MGLYIFKITIIINIGNSLFKERVIQSSQQCSVGWEDPTEQQEKARVCFFKQFFQMSINIL